MKYFPERLTLIWLKNSYKSGELTPYELAEEIVRRAADKEDYNIWIVKPSLERMKRYIDRLPDYSEKYPLWGIPFAIKDNIDLEEVFTTAACKEYEYLPKENAAVVDKLIAAGAIPVGKTNMDQFATGLVGTRSPYGEVHNAWNREFISGGSSSGSAVAAALGMAAFSLGTDTAGSGRVPAALNCLVGYKPALGAWSTRGVVPACASLDCVTVFANNLMDAKEVNLEARGEDKGCCWSRSYETPEYELPNKICLVKSGLEFYGTYAGIYEEKWNQAVERIKTCGIKVEYIDYSMFSEAASILYEGPWVAERWKDLGGFVEAHPGKIFPVTETILRSGARAEHTAVKMFEAMHKLQGYRAQAKQVLKDAVLIMPTAGGTFTREEVRKDPIAANSKMGLYTNHCNLLDLCAIAVPENMTDKELPFGITIFALAEAESLILGMAEQFLQTEAVPIAVCGLHKKNYPLESQLTELGARYLERTKTIPGYELYELNTSPVKPGMIYNKTAGAAIEVDLYELPVSQYGKFMRQVKQPLCIGTIILSDGRRVQGFLCEAYAVKDAKNVTAAGTFEITE
ncbi:MAG: allophanate hydrolase [Anaerocolumna sp.]